MHIGTKRMNRMRDAKHFRQPIFLARTRSISYKLYEFAAFENILNEQSTTSIKRKRAFRHGEEVLFHGNDYGSAADAIEAAKRRAGSRFTSSRSQLPTSFSEIVVSTGEGRATREVEFIWWPNLYKTPHYGKLAIRFYVSKTTTAQI